MHRNFSHKDNWSSCKDDLCKMIYQPPFGDNKGKSSQNTLSATCDMTANKQEIVYITFMMHHHDIRKQWILEIIILWMFDFAEHIRIVLLCVWCQTWGFTSLTVVVTHLSKLSSDAAVFGIPLSPSSNHKVCILKYSWEAVHGCKAWSLDEDFVDCRHLLLPHIISKSEQVIWAIHVIVLSLGEL